MVTIEDQGLSYVQYKADGVAVNFMLTFPYLRQEDITVYLDGVVVSTDDWSWLNDSEIQMDTAPDADALLTIKRTSEQQNRLVDFTDGGFVSEEVLDLDSNQMFYLSQEAIDTTNFNLAINSADSTIDARNNKIINLAEGTNPTDAINKSQLDDVESIATGAAATANNALSVANGIAATAAEALSDAEAAIAAANTAIATANAASATANAIAATADEALADAEAAQATASSALSAANTAQADATQALSDASDAQDAADAAQSDIDSSQSAITGGLGTGVVSFAGLSINANPAKFDVGAMDAWYVDNTTTPLTPTRVQVSLPAQTAISVTNLATHLATYIGQTVSGVIIQSTTPFTAAQRRTIIALGQIIHSDHIVVNAVNNNPTVSYAPTNQLEDLIEGIGAFNMSGNSISANGANLNINKSAGMMFKRGSNYTTDPLNPHQRTLSALTAATFRYRTQLSAEGSNVTAIDPTLYDLAGVLTAVPAGTNFTVQRVAVFQSNLIRIQYGQAFYTNLANALAAIGTETFNYEQNIRDNGMIIGYIVVRKNATDLSNAAQCQFVQAPKFAGGSAGGIGTVPTLQAAYNNSTTPEITTDSTLGALSLKRGSAADTDDVFEIMNGAGTKTASIKGNGNITGAIVDPTRLDVKKDTKANLDFYATTATNGQLCFATDTKQTYQVVDGILRLMGGSTGGLQTAFQLTAEENITDWSTGDNATFLGTGTISGTFAKETSSPMNGLASYRYTQAAGSLNDYMASPAQSIASKFRNRELTLYFPYTYDGSNSDIEVILYDATNSVIIPSSIFLEGTAGQVKVLRTNFIMPSTCTQFRVGFQTRVLNSGKILNFDDIQVSSDATAYANINQTQTSYKAGVTLGVATLTGALSGSNGSGLYTYNSSTGVFTASRDISVVLVFNAQNSTTLTVQPVINSNSGLTTSGSTANSTGLGCVTTATGFVPAGGTWYFSNANSTTNGYNAQVTAIATSQNIVTAPDTFSTDTAPLVYASSSTYTLSTLANAPVGTFITFTNAINTAGTRTQTTTAPTQTTSDMNSNGILMYTRAYNTASTAAQPSTWAIQIGKNLKGTKFDAYKSSGKVTSGSVEYWIQTTTTDFGGLFYYDEKTGVLLVDFGGPKATTNTSANFVFNDNTSATSAYVVINASKNPALTGLNISAVAARGVNSSGTSISNAGNVTITYDSTKTYDTHGALNTSTGVFTAPESGYYIAIGNVWYASSTYAVGNNSYAIIYKNGSVHQYGPVYYQDRATSISAANSVEAGVFLLKNETLSLVVVNGRTAGATALESSANQYTSFVVHKTSVG